LTLFIIFITAHRKGSFVSVAYAYPSVRLSVRLYVTLLYCVKKRERRRMQSSPPGSPVPVVF